LALGNHVPVNADVHDIKVIFVEQPDEIVNPLGIKGLGEIGIVGGDRQRGLSRDGKARARLPITLDQVVQSIEGHRQTQNPGTAGSSLPPARTGATRSARPVESSVSTATPLSVATPAAGSKRPEGMPVVKRRSGSSFCMPMMES